MNLKKYRIEIPSRFLPFAGLNFKLWIGENLELVSSPDDAVACTHEQMMYVMETIDCEAIAFVEKNEV